MRTGFPWVQLKLGASLDGRTAMASGESQWITSPQARRDVQRLRAQSHAILTSSATVLADDPALTVRWQELSADTQALYPEENLRQPLRVLSSIARTASRRSIVLCSRRGKRCLPACAPMNGSGRKAPARCWFRA